jgi:hypothetical protein
MPQPIPGDLCSVDGCGRPRAAKTNGTRRSMCSGHYSRKQVHGDVRADQPIVAYAPSGTGHVGSGGYWLDQQPDHPLAFPSSGKVLRHRAVLYESIGPGSHPCHWCKRMVAWEDAPPNGLVADHVDGDRFNNDPANLVPSCQTCNLNRGLAGNPSIWSPTTADTR